MKIALFHNPNARNGMSDSTKLRRSLQDAGFDVFYVSRLAPLLARRNSPFCILPLGTANNCARSLGQMHTFDSIVPALRSDRIRKLDLGIVTDSVGSRIFMESIGIGLLAGSICEMHALKNEKKHKSEMRLDPQKKLAIQPPIGIRMHQKKSASSQSAG